MKKEDWARATVYLKQSSQKQKLQLLRPDHFKLKRELFLGSFWELPRTFSGKSWEMFGKDFLESRDALHLGGKEAGPRKNGSMLPPPSRILWNLWCSAGRFCRRFHILESPLKNPYTEPQRF